MGVGSLTLSLACRYLQLEPTVKELSDLILSVYKRARKRGDADKWVEREAQRLRKQRGAARRARMRQRRREDQAKKAGMRDGKDDESEHHGPCNPVDMYQADAGQGLMLQSPCKFRLPSSKYMHGCLHWCMRIVSGRHTANARLIELVELELCCYVLCPAVFENPVHTRFLMQTSINLPTVHWPSPSRSWLPGPCSR